jgi:MarR family transcriptional regulator, transcriptional regulator for hemolysin
MALKKAERLAELTYALLEHCQAKQERLAAGLGLTITEFRLLRSFDGIEALAAGELAGTFGVSAGRLTRIVDGLERKHLVRRTAAADDHRVVRIELTARGLRMQKHLLGDLTATHEEILRSLPDGGADAVLVALTKLNEAMKEWGRD